MKYRSLNFKENLLPTIVYFSLRIIVIFIFVLNILNRNYENAFICLLTLVLLVTPLFIEEKFNIEIPGTLEVIIFLFIFAAEILGELNSFYTLFPKWDMILHTINGFIMGAIGLFLIELLNDSDKVSIKLSPLFVAIVSFCFSMTIGVVWEFFEFGMDNIFNLDMQKDTVVTKINSVTFDPDGLNKVHTINIDKIVVNEEEWNYGGYIDIGLIDTMNDLLVNFVGASLFAVLGYFYSKYKKDSGIKKILIMPRK